MWERKGLTRQCLAGCTANLVAMASGCMLGWTSPTLPKLDLPGAFIHPTTEQGSWIGSLVPLGAVIGPFPAGYLADTFGRKRTLLGIGFPILLSWILVTSAHNVPMIYLGRFIGGIGLGAAYTVAPMYTGEIAEDTIRGGLGSTFFFFLSAGYLFEYSIGPYVSYVQLGIISMFVPIVFVGMFFFMPESPYYLLTVKRAGEASQSLQWLRNATEDGVDQELQVMQEYMDEVMKNSYTFKDLVGISTNLKALCLSCSLVGFEIFTGIDAVLFYSSYIFKLAGGSLSDDLSTIVVGVVMLISSVVAPLFVDKTGRKPMLYASAFGMAAAEFILGLYFYYKNVSGEDISFLGWLPVISVVFFIGVYSIGYGPLPYSIMSELSPPNIKCIASAIAASFDWFFGFVITKWFQNISQVLGMHVAFWIFTGFCLVSNVFVFLFLPETKGKSLKEIQDILQKPL